ncbi:hypothetical protein CI610_03377 [invertebrate metagenome]|uniref:Uncharacterized protein n=1 Tax=invertebrate metagenome TaxID=1711999 RepID=A0A2H9T3C1_9ZZZZ
MERIFKDDNAGYSFRYSMPCWKFDVLQYEDPMEWTGPTSGFGQATKLVEGSKAMPVAGGSAYMSADVVDSVIKPIIKNSHKFMKLNFFNNKFYSLNDSDRNRIRKLLLKYLQLIQSVRKNSNVSMLKLTVGLSQKLMLNLESMKIIEGVIKNLNGVGDFDDVFLTKKMKEVMDDCTQKRENDLPLSVVCANERGYQFLRNSAFKEAMVSIVQSSHEYLESGRDEWH